MSKAIAGFSKLTKNEKIAWIAKEYFSNPDEATALIQKYWNTDRELQKLHDEFIENTITNFYLPLGIAPNFNINGKDYTIPMAIEESSVVAAASKSAKFWATRGGFKATVLNTEKIGQVHFMFKGDSEKLQTFFNTIKPKLFSETESITVNMQKRGGGILDIELRDRTDLLPNYYQLHATFETVDSMGANFINSCLEQFAKILRSEAQGYINFTEKEQNLQVVMSILSNYVPNCVVRAEVSCPVADLNEDATISPEEFAEKFITAVQIAEVEPFRAVTHNKGIMNGIDAVVLATGNDFRAVEAGIHAYASKNGKYSSLSHATVENGIFRFWIDVPLALGTVGGLTSLHPLVKLALEMLGKPSARELMQIVAVAGLAQNFAALRSLTTTGIQQGHMKMHLMNILNQLEATETEKQKAIKHFEKNTVSHSAAGEFIRELRNVNV
ncbi:hydroxymethylglutaryl-CoA reductase, degradative [Flavobacterium salilacus subsp. salilacus]|uniref:hydroxymethylglutaryl-CoA reductase, degradative n=1 Tax=Flavobacterium TaxID=237 RepID=UPI0010757A50|nr:MULTISPECIES: hydroxymethylglutaryl-CoA reductase, degradative [Flavobacterium]KAF2519969.1 hydroxymethylglutaryl-CoA reductase, degradative [Flavobacterium salilacus subsp. salilacus]MBE1614119.1 hydroxymethylglutaryl-CoA reductase, degradative [Flavobacterium sp. SaA2.13]